MIREGRCRAASKANVLALRQDIRLARNLIEQKLNGAEASDGLSDVDVEEVTRLLDTVKKLIKSCDNIEHKLRLTEIQENALRVRNRFDEMVKKTIDEIINEIANDNS